MVCVIFTFPAFIGVSNRTRSQREGRRKVPIEFYN